MTANISNQLRKAVYRRDHYRCVLCDSSDGIQIHHVIPRGEGGASTMQNLVTLCWRDHAFIHEGKRWSIGDDWTSLDAAQMCLEYLADMYTDDRHFWNPWEKDPMNPGG